MLCLPSSQVHIPFLPRFLSKTALRCPLTSLSTSAHAKTMRAVLDPWLEADLLQDKEGWAFVQGWSSSRYQVFFRSPDLLPPGLTLMADITCFWIQTSKDPSLGPLRPRHRAWISSIVKAVVCGPWKTWAFRSCRAGCELWLHCVPAGGSGDSPNCSALQVPHL